jgi:NAD(P)-dependent dehydrogenase (short-subunit alcohol dehydrogenase family)
MVVDISTDPRAPLAGQGAIVTGAAGGIGRAIALLLAACGASVAALDRDAEGLAETCAMIAGSGEAAVAHGLDLADASAISDAVETTLRVLGRIDILVNCAGIIGQQANLLAADEAVWDQVFAVNAKAPFLLIQHVGRHMVARGGGGRIVNITSSSAHRARASLPAYGASKAALTQLTRLAAAELGPHGVNVNAVAPGLTATRMVSDHFDPPALEAALREGPVANLLQRISEPEDVAQTVLFLCLPASRQITGQTVHVSAGAVV